MLELPLEKDLQQKKASLQEFSQIALRVLQYLPNVLSKVEEKGDYQIFSSYMAGTTKYVRPINKNIFISDPAAFRKSIDAFDNIIYRLKSKQFDFEQADKNLIDSHLYTIQQSIGSGLDLLVDPNSARKHAGNRFEELIKVVFTVIGIANKRTVLRIPYETDEGQKFYVCENDLILSADPKLLKSKTIDEKEIVVSVKTTSKDRMGKMFIDKILLERFVEHKLKVIGIFLNDVQRKEGNNISFTLVSGLFMVYNRFLSPLQGVYYLDPPPNARKTPFNKHIKSFSELITTDIHAFLTS